MHQSITATHRGHDDKLLSRRMQSCGFTTSGPGARFASARGAGSGDCVIGMVTKGGTPPSARSATEATT